MCHYPGVISETNEAVPFQRYEGMRGKPGRGEIKVLDKRRLELEV